MKAVQQKWVVIVAMAFMLCLAGLVISGTAFCAGGPQCVDNEDGTVTDNGSGLMWQKATIGRMKWEQAMSYTSGLSLGGHSGWRLPGKDELMGLHNSPCKDMMVVRSSPLRDCFYWSSLNANYGYHAWCVSFTRVGYANRHTKQARHNVRAVRWAY
ncbi:MAG: DUF1566 domain-containing protein [Desulfovibrionales bacterium]